MIRDRELSNVFFDGRRLSTRQSDRTARPQARDGGLVQSNRAEYAVRIRPKSGRRSRWADRLAVPIGIRVFCFVQRSGVGIALARRTLATNGNPPPEFEVRPEAVHVTVGLSGPQASRIPGAFRFLAHREMASDIRNASIVLIDVGPNLGAVNRAALLAAHYVVVPWRPISIRCRDYAISARPCADGGVNGANAGRATPSRIVDSRGRHGPSGVRGHAARGTARSTCEGV